MKYININKQIIETEPEFIATNREEFENGGYVELTEDIEDMLEDENFDILEWVFPAPWVPTYTTYAHQSGIHTILNELNPRNYAIGSTVADFKAGMYIPLSDEQKTWYNEHNDAEPIEVLGMAYDLDIQKQKKLAALMEYDDREDVNSFTVNGLNAWLTVPERTNYNTSIEAAQELGHESVTFLIAGQTLTVSTAQAKQMLAAVQLYADACYIVTQTHAAAINSLDSAAAVMAYDFTQGYPQKLVFTI